MRSPKISSDFWDLKIENNIYLACIHITKHSEFFEDINVTSWTPTSRSIRIKVFRSICRRAEHASQVAQQIWRSIFWIYIILWNLCSVIWLKKKKTFFPTLLLWIKQKIFIKWVINWFVTKKKTNPNLCYPHSCYLAASDNMIAKYVGNFILMDLRNLDWLPTSEVKALYAKNFKSVDGWKWEST